MSTVIYIHIPKCAGSTALGILHPLFKDEEIFRQRGSVIQEYGWLRDKSDEEKMRLRLVCGHMCYGWHEALAEGQPYTYITLLRDPVNRVLSFCRYVERFSWHTMNEVMLDFDSDWAKFVSSGRCRAVDNGMVRILCGADQMWQADKRGDMKLPYGSITEEHLEMAKENLKRFAVIGITEQFDLFMHQLRAQFGWEVPLAYKSVNSQGRLRKEDYPWHVYEAIREATRLDQKLYSWAIQERMGGTIYEAPLSWFGPQEAAGIHTYRC